MCVITGGRNVSWFMGLSHTIFLSQNPLILPRTYKQSTKNLYWLEISRKITEQFFQEKKG